MEVQHVQGQLNLRRGFYLFNCRVVLVLVLLSSMPPLTTAQSSAPADPAVVLLQNEQQLLPLRRLDTLSIAWIHLYGPRPDTFGTYLNKYTQVEELERPPLNASRLVRSWVRKKARQYDLFVVTAQEIPVSETMYAGLTFYRSWFQTLQEQASVVSVLFDAENLLRQVPELGSFPAIISAPGDMLGQARSAQLIFGGYASSARLQQDLSPRFGRGDGLTSAPASRLGYAEPQEVGMDASLLRDSITAIVEEGIRQRAFPSAQVLVARKGKVIYHEAFGYHTYDSLRASQRSDIYDLASITKASSGLLALMRWYGEGTLKLEMPLGDLFPGLRRSNKDDLPLRDLLTHQARLLPWIPYWKGTLRGHGRYPWRKRWDAQRINDRDFRRNTFAADSSAAFPVFVADGLWLHRRYRKKIYKAIRKSPLNEKPGYRYSGLFFYLLPEIVADRSGREYRSYLQQEFYAPLGASTLGYRPLERFSRKQIVPTERDTFFRMELLHGRVHDEGASIMGGVSGNAGLFAAANDLAKLWQMYLQKGYYGGRQFLPERAVEEFIRCQFCSEGNKRGLGFDKPPLQWDSSALIAREASPESYGHSGYTGTLVWADPKEELLFIFFSNRVHPTRLNRELYTRRIRPRIHRVLYEAIERELR